MTQFNFDITAANTVADEQKDIDAKTDHKKTVSAEVNEAVNGAKVRQHANMMAALKDAPKTRGQLSRSNRAKVEDAMSTVGMDINKGYAKHLYDNSVALTTPATYKDIFGEDMPSQATASYFEARLIEQNMNSQKAIEARVFPAKSDDDIDKIVRKVVGGFTYAKDENGQRQRNNWRAGKLLDQYDEVITALQNAKRISDAVAEVADMLGLPAVLTKLTKLTKPPREPDRFRKFDGSH